LPRGLDHIVHAVHDLDAACAFYRRLGFTVGARNRHPAAWGTENHIVQLPGFFVELLSVADTANIVPHRPRFFSFGAFNRDFLARGAGLSMLALESKDARADAEAFRVAGIGDFDAFDFERDARRPDGVPVKVAFSLAFARDPHADAAFFTCQQHYPENFWNPAFQVHANTSESVVAVVLVAERPEDHRVFLSSLVGQRSVLVGEHSVTAMTSGLTIATSRGEIRVMDRMGFVSHFGIEPPDTSAGARLVAIQFAVRDLAAAVVTLQKADIAEGASMRSGRIVIRPAAAMDATIIFEQR
jgi:catechol 2,3-dioxygenase-like lactoylglutathione lyase family enzyme